MKEKTINLFRVLKLIWWCGAFIMTMTQQALDLVLEGKREEKENILFRIV